MKKLFLLLVLFSGPVLATEVEEDPLERQVLEISKDLRCAVCQNQPVSESNSDLAKDMRVIIREQLEAGKTRQEIVDYFVSRYGNYVLMKPPLDQTGSLLWAAPVLILISMAVGGWIYIRSRQRAAPSPAPELSAEDRARVKSAEDEAREDSDSGSDK